MTTVDCISCGKPVTSETEEAVEVCESCNKDKVEPSRTMTGEEKIAALREIDSGKSWGFVGGVVVDINTANAILTVYDNISQEHQQKYIEFDIVRMANIAWKLITQSTKQPKSPVDTSVPCLRGFLV